jgi:hypothetical protein
VLALVDRPGQPLTRDKLPLHGQAKAREVQGQLEAQHGGAGSNGVERLEGQQRGVGDGDATGDEFLDKTRFFASNAAGRGDPPGGEGDQGPHEAATTSSAGVKAMRAEIDRLRRAVSDEQAASATLRARMRVLESAAASPHGQASGPRTMPQHSGDGGNHDEVEALREENAALAGDVEAAQEDADAAAATARLVGAQLERARTVLVAEQGRVRTLEAAMETQRGKAVALARLMRVQVQAAASGKPVDWPAVDALAAAATAPVPLAEDEGSADTSFDTRADEAQPPFANGESSRQQRRPGAAGAASATSSSLEQQYAALRAAFAALQRKHEGLQHSETLLCAALTAAHSALDSQQQQQQQRNGGASTSGRATPSPAHSPRTARRLSNSSKAGGSSPVFVSSVMSREEALSAALQSERAAAAAAEAHLQRELGDLQRKASALSYELTALKAVQTRSEILGGGVVYGGHNHAAGRVAKLRERGGDNSDDDADRKAAADEARRQLAAARAEVADLSLALRLALTSGVNEYAAALASIEGMAAVPRGSDAALALKATLAKYLVQSGRHGAGGGGHEGEATSDTGDGHPSSFHASAALEAARQEAADAEARALAAESECVALRRRLGQEQSKPAAEEALDNEEPHGAAADAPPEQPHETEVQPASDGGVGGSTSVADVHEAPVAEAIADPPPPPPVAPHAPPPAPALPAPAQSPGPSQPVVLKAKPLPRTWPKTAPPPEAEDAPAAAASGDDGGDSDASSGEAGGAAGTMPQLRVRTSRSQRWAAGNAT